MPIKTFLEKISKFVPTDEQREILENVSDYTIKVDKERRILEAKIHLSFLVNKQKLYRIEREIEKAYELKHARLLPSYPSELFEYSYVPQILIEAETIGIVARGFFSDYDYTLTEEELSVSIPFSRNGVLLLEDAKTPEIIEKIIFSEFGIQRKVKICHTKDNDATAEGITYSESMQRELEAWDKRLQQADQQYEQYKSYHEDAPGEGEANESKQTLPRISSIYDEKVSPEVQNGIVTIGHAKFDISNPRYVIGENFEIRPTPISLLTKPERNIVVLGEVFGVSKDTNRTGDKINMIFYVTDGNASIEIKKFGLDMDAANELSETIHDGAVLAIKGNAKFEIRKEKRDEDLTFHYDSIAEISKIGRQDKAEKKRVELHLHTNMSAMDALIPPDVAVKTAHKWGHPAIAITDHGNVQGYPEAMLAAEKCGMKVIYGIEAYFVNDTAGAVTGN